MQHQEKNTTAVFNALTFPTMWQQEKLWWRIRWGRMYHVEDTKISLPTELGDTVEGPNEIHTQVQLINVDSINTFTMVVGLTVERTHKWKDHNIDYKNINKLKNEECIQSTSEEKDKINPSPPPVLLL